MEKSNIENKLKERQSQWQQEMEMKEVNPLFDLCFLIDAGIVTINQVTEFLTTDRFKPRKETLREFIRKHSSGARIDFAFTILNHRFHVISVEDFETFYKPEILDSWEVVLSSFSWYPDHESGCWLLEVGMKEKTNA